MSAQSLLIEHSYLVMCMIKMNENLEKRLAGVKKWLRRTKTKRANPAVIKF